MKKHDASMTSDGPSNITVTIRSLRENAGKYRLRKFLGITFAFQARVPFYRSRALGSILGATRISENYWVWKGADSASWVQLRSYLEETLEAPV
jgi:hypothetical protein